MLYKKNSAKTLDKNLFENPTAEYRGTPFWSWNCKLDKEQLLRQIESLKEMGFGGFHMHARTGLDTEYLGDEFMEMVTACCDKAEQEEMLAWLYDEDRWSSGPAGGKVTKRKEFRRKRLELYPEDKGWDTPKAEALKSGEPYFLACYDVVLDKEGFLVKGERISPYTKPEGIKWYAYVVNEKESTWFNGQTYVDTMDKEAIEEFVKVTHERYKEVIGEKFGESVPAIFTDEPNFHHEYTSTLPDPFYQGRILYGWSRFFEEEYQKEYGQDILEVLPELFWNTQNRRDSLIKYRYYNLCGKLFNQNFFGTIGDWCRKNNLAFTGHLLREPHLFGQTQNVSDCMRCYGNMDIPGIDILCNEREFTTAKQTQSAVHQYGKEGMLSELYGVTNWDFDFRGHKFQGDWQAALGVTVRVPHLAWVSMAGEAKRDYPAAIGYQSPWYREYTQIEDHYARVNTALTRGKPIVKIGVIHPIESSWILMGPNSQCGTQITALDEQFRQITQELIANHLDFDFICEATLPELQKENPSAVGEMSYDAIVIPGCLTLRSSTIAYLKRFRTHGGKVIFMGDCPAFVDGVVSSGVKELFAESTPINFDISAMTEVLKEVQEISMRFANGRTATNLIYNYRQDTDCRWLFLAHLQEPGAQKHGHWQKDVIVPKQITITVRGAFTPMEYDTMTGEIKPMTYQVQDGVTVIETSIDGYDSLLIQLQEKTADFYTLPEKRQEIVAIADVKHTVSYTMSEPNVLLLDRGEFAIDDESFAPEEELLRADNMCRERLGYPLRAGKLAQPYTMKKEPAAHTLHLRFTVESEAELEGIQLALEDAETAAICFNGEAVESKVTGYFTDEAIQTVALPRVKQGTNILTVSLPYGKRTNVEWCYLLGEFGVRVMGCQTVLTQKPKTIGFGDVCSQGLPFYGANLTYEIEVTMPEDGALAVQASKYRGALIGVSLDGEHRGSIIFPPYRTVIENVTKGTHTVSLTVYGNRHNSFGALHNANDGATWFGPDIWRTKDEAWCYEYNLRPFGILKSPVITIMK